MINWNFEILMAIFLFPFIFGTFWILMKIARDIYKRNVSEGNSAVGGKNE